MSSLYWLLPPSLESSFLDKKQLIYLDILFLGNFNFFHRRNTTRYFSFSVFSSKTFFRRTRITACVSASVSSPMRRSKVSPTFTWKKKTKNGDNMTFWETQVNSNICALSFNLETVMQGEQERKSQTTLKPFLTLVFPPERASQGGTLSTRHSIPATVLSSDRHLAACRWSV